jgi:two-component system response regulator MprA
LEEKNLDRVLVVDDDPKITAFLRRALVLEGYEVAVAQTGADGLRSVAEAPPELVILDIMMPGIDGLEVCKRLRTAGEGMPVLLLTARDAVADRVKGLDAGADDYLVKPFALEELLARVRALLRRRSAQPAEEATQPVLAYADLTLDPATREVSRGQNLIELTAKEFDLLHILLQYPRQVLSKDLLMDRVWGHDWSGESNVVEVYIMYLRQKLGEPRLIQTVRGAGYALKE